MKRNLLSVLTLAAIGLSASAITPLWLRDVKISPDGKEILFTYKGDIYKVPAKGGNAVRLTSGEAYESNPVWSPEDSIRHRPQRRPRHIYNAFGRRNIHPPHLQFGLRNPRGFLA